MLSIATLLNSLQNQSSAKNSCTKALKNGQFIALKIFLARTGRPDFETMQSELNYVSVYAIHKAKLLE